MYLLLGDLNVDRGNHERAIQLFQHAQAKLGDRTSQVPLVVSLVNFLPFLRNSSHLATNLDRCLDGNLIILASQFDSTFVKRFIWRGV